MREYHISIFAILTFYAFYIIVAVPTFSFVLAVYTSRFSDTVGLPTDL